MSNFENSLELNQSKLNFVEIFVYECKFIPRSQIVANSMTNQILLKKLTICYIKRESEKKTKIGKCNKINYIG